MKAYGCPQLSRYHFMKIAELSARLFAKAPAARFVIALMIGALAAVAYYSPSSAAGPKKDPLRSAVTGINQIHRIQGSEAESIVSPSLANGAFLTPEPPAPGLIATYAADCSTPKTEFAVGDAVCVKVTGIAVGGFFPRLLTWGTTDSTVVRTTTINSDPKTDTLTLTATTNVNGRTVDNRGTWVLLVRNPFFFFPEAFATFTVTDPANPSADLGVSTTANSNQVAADAQAVYEIQVSNLGPDASNNVSLTDAVPSNSTFVSFDQLTGPIFTCTNPNVGDSGTTTCSIASLAPNSVATFIATYKVNSGVTPGTTVSNAAQITSLTTQDAVGTADPNNLNDSSSADSIVAAAPCVLSCPGNIDTPADTGQAGAVVTFATPSFTGDCGTPTIGEGGETIPAISCSPASGSFFPAGTTTVVCSGQTTGVCTFQVTVENPGGLSITLNGATPVALECGDDFNDPSASAVNATGQAVPVTITGNLDIHTPGSYTLTYTATEGVNSTSTQRVVNVSDSAAPSITLNGQNPMTVGCGSPFVDPGASADDACEGSKAVSTSGTVNTNVPGTYTVTYSATDSQNHTATTTRTVIVEAGGGSTPPNIILNGDPQMTAECGSFVDPGATATIPCGGSLPVTVSGAPPANTPGLYVITYTACVEDTPGHCDPARTASVERTVQIQDTSAPTIVLNGANPITVECHTSFTDPGAVAQDACAGNSAAAASGSVNPNVVGQYTITYTASDPSGHVATPVTRTVNVVDTIGPVITINGANPATVECHTSYTDAGATASDACNGPVSVSVSGSVNVNVTGTYTITYSATDGTNTTTATRTVNVADVTPPVITVTSTIFALWAPNHGFVNFNVSDLVTSVSDSCNTNLGVSSVVITKVTSDEPDSAADMVIAPDCKSVQLAKIRLGNGDGRVYTVTFKVTDSSGNSGYATKQIIVPNNQSASNVAGDSGVKVTVTSSCGP